MYVCVHIWSYQSAYVDALAGILIAEINQIQGYRAAHGMRNHEHVADTFLFDMYACTCIHAHVQCKDKT
jgi:hypothetical protein